MAKIKYCPNCGAENPDESMFCIKCGQAFPQQDVKELKAETKNAVENKDETPKQRTESPNDQKPIKQPEKKKGIVGIIISAVVILIVVVVLIVIGNKASEDLAGTIYDDNMKGAGAEAVSVEGGVDSVLEDFDESIHDTGDKESKIAETEAVTVKETEAQTSGNDVPITPVPTVSQEDSSEDIELISANGLISEYDIANAIEGFGDTINMFDVWNIFDNGETVYEYNNGAANITASIMNSGMVFVSNAYTSDPEISLYGIRPAASLQNTTDQMLLENNWNYMDPSSNDMTWLENYGWEPLNPDVYIYARYGVDNEEYIQIYTDGSNVLHVDYINPRACQ